MTRALVVVLLLMAGAPAMAGTGVGQSTWNRGQAIKRAIKNKPPGRCDHQAPLQRDQCAAQHLLDLLCELGLSVPSSTELNG